MDTLEAYAEDEVEVGGCLRVERWRGRRRSRKQEGDRTGQLNWEPSPREGGDVQDPAALCFTACSPSDPRERITRREWIAGEPGCALHG
jgi:hypothetical protein